MANTATTEPVEMQASPDIFTKTKLCKFYLLGICAKGESCLFAHERDELNPMPDLFRTKLCSRLINRGTCDDKQCTYAHSKEELRTAEIRPMTREPPAYQQVENYCMRQPTFVPVIMVPLQPGFVDAQSYQMPPIQQPSSRLRRRRGGHQHQAASGLQGTSSDEGLVNSGKDGDSSRGKTPSTTGTMSTSAQANDGNSSDADIRSNNSTYVIQQPVAHSDLTEYYEDGVVVVKNTFLCFEPRLKEVGLRQVHTADGRLDQMCGQD